MRALNITLAWCVFATAISLTALYAFEQPRALLGLIPALAMVGVVVWRYKIGGSGAIDLAIENGPGMIVWGGSVSFFVTFSMALCIRFNDLDPMKHSLARAMLAVMIGFISGGTTALMLGFAGTYIRVGRAARKSSKD